MHPTAPKATRRYVPGPDGQIHVYDTGGDGIPLVMLHQAPTSSLDFAATFPAFARAGQRLLAMDMPGYGMSDAPEEPATIHTYAAAALAMMDGLGVEKAHFLGHHTGIKVSVELAVAHPERAAKLVLYGPSLSTLEDNKPMWDALVPHEQAGAIHKPVPGGQHLADQFKRSEGYAGHEVAQRTVVTNLMAGPKWWYGHNAALTHDMTDSFLALKAPVMLLTNPGEMMLQKTNAMAARKPEAKLVTLKTHGAMAMDTDPEEFVAAVMAFLRET